MIVVHGTLLACESSGAENLETSIVDTSRYEVESVCHCKIHTVSLVRKRKISIRDVTHLEFESHSPSELQVMLTEFAPVIVKVFTPGLKLSVMLAVAR